MVRIHEIKLKPGEPEELLAKKAEGRLRLPAGCIKKVNIVKESLDAREKPQVCRVFSLDIEADIPDEAILAEAKRAHVKAAIAKEDMAEWPKAADYPKASQGLRPVIAGFGPCGIFAALTLAKAGAGPLVIERGAAMEDRIAAVEGFWAGGPLKPEANVQFGEGGAGSFSDGKLTTGTKAPSHRLILEALVEAGADPDILYKQHPHVGTDVLRTAVVNLRKSIEALGGEIRFNTRLEDVILDGGKVRAVRAVNTLSGEEELIETDRLVLALGHSARDSFSMLHSKGLRMEQKQFSMGVRIEHRQSDIDMAQYGALHESFGTDPEGRYYIGPAEYKLSCKAEDGRGVYTFCMCPGGYVVASASEEGGLCTNGMSNRARDAENANSAVLVDIRPEDFPSDHPLAGAQLQKKYERLAYETGLAAGGVPYAAPAQRVGDFLAGRPSNQEPPGPENRISEESEGCPDNAKGNNRAKVTPSYRPGVGFTDLRKCLPPYVSKALAQALPVFGRRLKGFDNPEAVMTAIEARSSSPVRIVRDMGSLNALNAEGAKIAGLYPGGEGAGYAGGIMSAAADGFKIAMAILEESRGEGRL